MKIIKHTESPVVTHSASVYPYSDDILDRFTTQSKYDTDIKLYKVKTNPTTGKKWIWLPRSCCPIADNDKRRDGDPVKFDLDFTAQDDEQQRVIDEAIELLQAGESFIVKAPTGFGKTAISMPIIAAIGRKTLIVVTKDDVKSQWKDACKQFLGLTDKDIGYIYGDVCQVAGKKVVIASIKSICKEGRYPKGTFDGFGLMLPDEVHRLGADEFSNAAWQVPAKLRMGLSATPIRNDGKGIVLASHIGQVRVSSEAFPMIPKILVKNSHWKPPYKMKLSPGRTMHANVMIAQNMTRNRMMVEFMVSAYNKNRNIVFFSDLKDKHLPVIQDLLIMGGVKPTDIAFYVGGMKEEARNIAKKARVVLTTYAMCSEATDAPWWDVGVLGTPRSDVVQIVGRIIRKYKDKPTPVIFDVVDVTQPLFVGYAKKRQMFYKKIKAEVKQVL
ncbi:MAG: DEAD/DEAH box helicase [Helicobacteraceae bacterium]|nr:DEAD/DEAH box helicase [Helicobacteraceae bacterium]